MTFLVVSHAESTVYGSAGSERDWDLPNVTEGV